MKRIIIYTNKDKSNQRKIDINYNDFKMLKSNLLNINEYKMILYLSIYSNTAINIYKLYDFNKIVNEVEVSTYYSIIITTLYNNLELWKSFINKTFPQDEDLKIDGKPISQIYDSEYFDNHIEYVVFKALRNRVTHCQMPFSDICTYDDGSRHYLVFKKDLLSDNSSQKKKQKEYLNEDKSEFYDLNVIIDKAIEYITEINDKIFRKILEKYDYQYLYSMKKVLDYVGTEYEFAYLAWDNDDIEEMSYFKVEHIEVPLKFLIEMNKKGYFIGIE